MKQKVKRVLLVLMSVLTISFANAETIVSVGGLQYSLSGAYASVYRVASGNTSERITVPSTFTYEGLVYTVNNVFQNAFYSAYTNNNNVKEIILPSSIVTIENGAFCNSNITKVEMQEGIESIGGSAFGGSSITEILIPSTVKKLTTSTFNSCSKLRTIIYLGSTPPEKWTATSQTYVPSKTAYNSPQYSINNASIIEMGSFSGNTFAYTGEAPKPTWINNVEGYTTVADISKLKANAGGYAETIPVTFTKGERSFTANIPYEYTITPAKLTAKVANSQREYGEVNPQFDITYSGFLNGDNESVITASPSVSTSATKTSEVGAYTVTISGGNAKNYTFEYKSGILTITKAPLVVQVKDATRVYGSNNPTFTLSYTGLKNGEVNPKWTSNPVYTTEATLTSNVGKYNVSVNCNPKNYTITQSKTGILEITQAPLTIKLNDVTKTYGEEDVEYTIAYSGFANGDDESCLTSKPTIQANVNVKSDVGSYEIIAKGANAQNYTISYVPGILTIAPRQLIVIANDTSRIYGDENPVFTVRYSGFVNGDASNVITTAPQITITATAKSDVGTYPIAASGGYAKNYSFKYEQGTLTINKAELSVQVNDATKRYGENNPNFSIRFTGLKGGEGTPAWTTAPTYQTMATKQSEVGTYDVSVSCLPKNYEIKDNISGTLTITKASLIIGVNNATRLYGEDDAIYSFAYSGFVNGDGESCLTTKPTIQTDANVKSDVGTYKITPNGATAKNYEISYLPATLTIGQRPLIVTPQNTTRLYGYVNPEFSATYIGFVNKDTVDVLANTPILSTTATEVSDVGTYPITAKGGSAKNYVLKYEEGTLSILKAPLTATVKDVTRIYGQNNPNLAIEYSGLKNSETAPKWVVEPTIETTATRYSDVGEYAIVVTGAIPVNYEMNDIEPGKLTIEPAEAIIKVSNASRKYYTDNPQFQYYVSNSSGNNIALDTIPTLSTTAVKTSNVGTYPIEASGAVAKNYTFKYEQGVMTITPCTLTASVNDYQRNYGEENPNFTVSYSGFVGDDDEKSLTEQAVASTQATKAANVGTYPINVSGGNAKNYQFSYKSGTLTVNMAEQTIKWEQDLSKLKVGDQVELKAEASSGQPITYTMDNTDAGEIYKAGSKTFLDCLKAGQFLIRAVQTGNTNYYSSPRASNTVVINGNAKDDPLLTIVQGDNGSISTRVRRLSVHTFNIKSWEGWEIHSVTFNNEDVTEQLDEANNFTTPPITENSTLYVIYEKNVENDVKAVCDSHVNIQGTSYGVRVIGANIGELIQVYTTDGIRQKSVKVDGTTTNIPLAKGNIYIIKVGEKTLKLRR